MTGLADFIRARLDEDEATARAATLGPWREDHMAIRGAPDGYPAASSIRDSLVVKHTWPQEAAHIIRHDPARVLREVAAKRRILAETFPLIESEWGGSFGMSRHGEELLRYLALPYSGHPDYDQSWSPAPVAEPEAGEVGT